MIATRVVPYRPNLMRRILLRVLLGLVALSVVGMHQLSHGHAFALPSATGHHHATGAHAAASTYHRDADDHVAPEGGSAALSAASPISNPGGASGDDSCPGCGQHSMALGACLLALSLLVLSWLLLPPRWRLLPPTRLRLVPTMVVAVRRVPALSLAELSILRT